jgi:hypothetical protein
VCVWFKFICSFTHGNSHPREILQTEGAILKSTRQLMPSPADAITVARSKPVTAAGSEKLTGEVARGEKPLLDTVIPVLLDNPRDLENCFKRCTL